MNLLVYFVAFVCGITTMVGSFYYLYENKEILPKEHYICQDEDSNILLAEYAAKKAKYFPSSIVVCEEKPQ